MNRLWFAVAIIVGVGGVLPGSVSAGTQPPPQLEKKFPRLERAATVVRLQVTPPANAPVGQVVTMKATIENPPLLIQGTGVVYQFEWREHAHGRNSSGNSGYHQATTWTFRPSRADLYGLRVNWAIADNNGNVRPGTGGSSDWYQLQVCAAGQSSC
jgi:hypothetical protein